MAWLRALHPLIRLSFVALLLSLLPLAASAATLTAGDGSGISYRVSPAKGNMLLLWFPCYQGLGPNEAFFLRQLAARGVETWVPDILDSHFLPPTPASLDKIPDNEIADLIGAAVSGGKRVALVAAGRAAANVLRGARLWQKRQATAALRHKLAGAILINPELYAGHPAPGTEAPYAPIVGNTRLPIVILQPMLSPGKWWVRRLQAALEGGGSQVKTTPLPAVGDAFFFRRNQTAAEAQTTRRLPQILLDSWHELQTLRLREAPHD